MGFAFASQNHVFSVDPDYPPPACTDTHPFNDDRIEIVTRYAKYPHTTWHIRCFIPDQPALKVADDLQAQ